MRIISGYFKGRRIDLPKNLKLRPTTDMAKESLFNVLSNLLDFDEVNALDLFSGTGSISYEMVSRGAKSVLSVDKNIQHIRFIESVKEKMEMENLRILRMDVWSFLKSSQQSYDLIFADPPYDMENFEQIPALILDKECLAPNGIFVLEHSKNYSFEAHPAFFDHRKYGAVNFSFFRNSSLSE